MSKYVFSKSFKVDIYLYLTKNLNKINQFLYELECFPLSTDPNEVIAIFSIMNLKIERKLKIFFLAETQIYHIPKGNLIKNIIVGATSIPVLTSSKSAGNSFNFSCVGWGLVSFIVTVRGYFYLLNSVL